MTKSFEECIDHAERCKALATMTANPILKEALVELARNWERIASLETAEEPFRGLAAFTPKRKTGCR
jgi:hypothetical protein